MRLLLSLGHASAAVAVLSSCAGSPNGAPAVPSAVASTAKAHARPVAPQASTNRPVSLNGESTCGLEQFRDDALQRINLERARHQQCGAKSFQPVPPLAWNDRLFSAAARHSLDMAQRNYFDHATPEGQRAGKRVSDEGFAWRLVGENIAAGNTTVETAMNSWMHSPDHCSNIMQPEYTDVAVACVSRGPSKWQRYWTMVLARRG